MQDIKIRNSIMSNKKVTSSKELLTIKRDGSKSALIQSLLENKINPHHGKKDSNKTFKVNRSPLFNQLQEFIPKIEKSTNELLLKSEDERKELDLENIEGCEKVVEMSILIGKDVTSEEESAEEEINTNIFSKKSSDSFVTEIENIKSKSLRKKKNKKKMFNPLITEIEDKKVSKLMVAETKSEKERIGNSKSSNSLITNIEESTFLRKDKTKKPTSLITEIEDRKLVSHPL